VQGEGEGERLTASHAPHSPTAGVSVWERWWMAKLTQSCEILFNSELECAALSELSLKNQTKPNKTTKPCSPPPLEVPLQS
jgi:hypothetical protein